MSTEQTNNKLESINLRRIPDLETPNLQTGITSLVYNENANILPELAKKTKENIIDKKILEIENNFEIIKQKLLISRDLDVTNKLNNSIETLIALLDIRGNQGVAVDFEKKVNQRNNKETQRNNFTPKCFKRNKKR